MAKLVFGMNVSLDGYVDHTRFQPDRTLFRHFIDEVDGQAGSIYGRNMYEIMRYWDEDHADWEPEGGAFAAAWRKQTKWVVSRLLKSVGPNASLVGDDLEGAIRRLKAEVDGEVEIAGPNLAAGLTDLGLVDEYRIYLHPVVLGHGTPYFAGPAHRCASSRMSGSVTMCSVWPTCRLDLPVPEGTAGPCMHSASIALFRLNDSAPVRKSSSSCGRSRREWRGTATPSAPWRAPRCQAPRCRSCGRCARPRRCPMRRW